MRHPNLVRDVVAGKTRDEIRAKIRTLDENDHEKRLEGQCAQFILELKKSLPSGSPGRKDLRLNKLCCVEDWENPELKELVSQLQSTSHYEKSGGILARLPGQIHRKDWEWAMGILAMRRLGKLNKNSVAVGIGAGKELVLFYLASYLGRVYATDLYGGKEWASFAPADFLESPEKYAPFPYDRSALTALRMDATRLDFPPNGFDVAFSFSSIEHFGGENHSGALKSLNEMERVLKPGASPLLPRNTSSMEKPRLIWSTSSTTTEQSIRT